MNTEPLRSTDIRERNEKLVLQLIHQEGQISQSEVALRTGLKPPTVFRIFGMLEKNGYILPVSGDRAHPSTVPGKKGRKPVAFQINPEAYYLIGIDWTRTPTLVVVDFQGEIRYSSTQEFPSDIEAEGSLKVIEGMIQSALQENSLPKEKILGIGIGLPGKVDIERGSIITYPRIPGMIDFPIRDRLENLFHIPVHVHNNTSVIALSEYRYGKAKGIPSFLTLLIRAGVGGAFVQNGIVFTNNFRTALEIGHLGIDPDGPLCYCGQKGCLETYLSEDAFLSEFQKFVPIKDLLGIESFIQEENPQITRVLEAKSEVLCRAIQSLGQVFSPDAVLIITRSQVFSERLVTLLSKTLCNPSSRALQLIPSHYKPTIAAKAATDLVFDAFFRA